MRAAIRESGGELQHTGGLATSATILRSASGLATHGGMFRIIPPGSEPFQTNWLCGAILMIRRTVYFHLGGFDPRYFLYFDETGFCRRAVNAGLELGAVGQAVGFHEGSASAKDQSDQLVAVLKETVFWGEAPERMSGLKEMCQTRLIFFLEVIVVRSSLQLQNSLIYCFLILYLSGNIAVAGPLQEQFLALDGQIDEDGTGVELSWAKAAGSKVGRATIQRRILNQTGKASWQSIGSTRSFARVYLDKEVRSGVAYEYRVSRPSKEQIETGYWVAGRDLTAQENRGVALVVVDETIAEGLSLYLDRFMLDLIGDGWKVIRHNVPRGDNKDVVANLYAARKIRAWVQARYHSAPQTPHALILIGQVPVVKSGHSNPDGHAQVPQETDLFYADVDGVWRDNGEGVLRHNVIPSDHIEMQVGRIDFSNLDPTLGDEMSLLKKYFNKNHHWRHGRLGDLRRAYGGNGHLIGETYALRNIVGPDNLVKGGHHDVGTQQPWLFGVDFGNRVFLDYTTKPSIKSVFSINFGSGKLRFSNPNNTMKAMLAQPWYGLATGWGARPTWQLHHMALGRSIGYSHMRTVNNGALSKGGFETLEYTPTGLYPWVNPIWVNLLGDPTLHPFPLQPVSDLRAEKMPGSVKLEWAIPDNEARLQYRVYRAPNRFGPYQALNPSALLSEQQYVDSNPLPGAWYMVRTHSLKEVYAGSFYTISQGAYAMVDNLPPKAIDQRMATPLGQKVAFVLAATDPNSENDLIVSIVKGPVGGYLTLSNEDWSFVPDVGFTGRVEIPFTVFDGIASDDGLITIDVMEQ